METTKKTKKPQKDQSLPKSGNLLSKEDKVKNLNILLRDKNYRNLFPSSININEHPYEDIKTIQSFYNVKVNIPKDILYSKKNTIKYIQIIKDKCINISYKLFKHCIDNNINLYGTNVNIKHYIKYINETNSLECLKHCNEENFRALFDKGYNCYSPYCFNYTLNNLKNKKLLNYNQILKFIKDFRYSLSKSSLLILFKEFESSKIQKYLKNNGRPFWYKIWLSVKGSLKDLEEHKNKSTYFKAILSNPNCSSELKDHIESFLAIKDILS